MYRVRRRKRETLCYMYVQSIQKRAQQRAESVPLAMATWGKVGCEVLPQYAQNVGGAQGCREAPDRAVACWTQRA